MKHGNEDVKEIVAVFNDTIAHWERMIRWAQEEPQAEGVNLTRMERFIGVFPGMKHCPLCKRYVSCDTCPLGRKVGACSTSRNLYPDATRCKTWFEWVNRSAKFLTQLRQIRNEYISEYAKSVDWSKPVQMIYAKDKEIVEVLPGYMVKTKGSCCYMIDKYGGDIISGRPLVENVPEFEFETVCMGDRTRVAGEEYIICRSDFGKMNAVNINTGNTYGHPTTVMSTGMLNEGEFKDLFGDPMWKEAYKNLVRRFKK